ncbi:hypothetical protein RQP46_004858 [Phenoliferia psychrophenolica]
MPVVLNAGILIIGDEVLNGKTTDSNSAFAAKLFFDCGVELKRIEVIADDEDEIIEAVRRMAANYDMVITSGGIGPTHDSKKRYNLGEQTEEQKIARNRMALFPIGSEILFVKEELWVPVVRVAGKVCILPGVPTLFQQLLTGLCARFVKLPPTSSKPFRLLIHTELPESSIAPFLTKLQLKVKAEQIRVGSYPKLNAGVDVSLIGKDMDRLKELSEEVIQELKGTLLLEGKLGEEVKK